jgi:multidrug resistance efflux pump
MAATFSRTVRSLGADDPPRRVVALLAGVFAISRAAWFLAARVPVHEVSADARLEVEAAAHPVAALVDGRVIATNLAIGRDVRAGEVLVVLDAEPERLAIRERRARRDGLVAELEAHRKQTAAEREVAAAHQAARTAAIGELRAKAEEAEARAKFADLQLNHLSALRARGAVAQEEYDRARAEAEALRAGVRTNRLAMERLEWERAIQQAGRRARITALEAAEVELRGEIATEEAAILRLEHTVDLRQIQAPLSERVGEVTPEFRLGSVARAGERLGAIVPPGVSRGVALFPAAAVGRIRPEQPARQRLHGFPWTQYGTGPDRVSRVGDEARGGLIRVELELRPDPRSPIPVAHGLPGTVEVEVEQVTPAVLVLRTAGR